MQHGGVAPGVPDVRDPEHAAGAMDPKRLAQRRGPTFAIRDVVGIARMEITMPYAP